MNGDGSGSSGTAGDSDGHGRSVARGSAAAPLSARSPGLGDAHAELPKTVGGASASGADGDASGAADGSVEGAPCTGGGTTPSGSAGACGDCDGVSSARWVSEAETNDPGSTWLRSCGVPSSTDPAISTAAPTATTGRNHASPVQGNRLRRSVRARIRSSASWEMGMSSAAACKAALSRFSKSSNSSVISSAPGACGAWRYRVPCGSSPRHG